MDATAGEAVRGVDEEASPKRDEKNDVWAALVRLATGLATGSAGFSVPLVYTARMISVEMVSTRDDLQLHHSLPKEMTRTR